jgi:hypothetical protein
MGAVGSVEEVQASIEIAMDEPIDFAERETHHLAAKTAGTARENPDHS